MKFILNLGQDDRVREKLDTRKKGHDKGLSCQILNSLGIFEPLFYNGSSRMVFLMKKEILNVLILLGLTAAIDVKAEGRPEVSICQGNDCQHLEDPIRQQAEETRSHVGRTCHDNSIVMKNFDMLALELDTMFRKEKSLKAEEMRSILSAIDFAADKHRLQTRKNKEKTPYISHPLGVAYNTVHFGGVNDAAIIIGALLHDTVEDTETTFEEIEKAFGKQVASYVREVTDDKTATAADRRRLQVINAPKISKGATAICLADKLYNVIDLLHNPPEGWSRIRVERYYQWVQSVIDRLPETNEKLKGETQKIINSYWEDQKASSSNQTANK